MVRGQSPTEETQKVSADGRFCVHQCAFGKEKRGKKSNEDGADVSWEKVQLRRWRSKKSE